MGLAASEKMVALGSYGRSAGTPGVPTSVPAKGEKAEY